jgi:putative NIF3 family GTP cyclohydrolase 1 type 2
MAITAQAIVDRIKQKLGPGWKDTPSDTFIAGNRDSEVKGIVTTYAPSLEVLEKVVASGKNMIITRESPFWARAVQPHGTSPGFVGPAIANHVYAVAAAAGGAQVGPPRGGAAPAGGAPPAAAGPARNQPSLDKDQVSIKKHEYIASNNLIVYRLFDNWNARQPDGQMQGLAKALGWEKSYRVASGEPWATNNGSFAIPQTTLKGVAESINKKLGSKSIRVAGHPDTRVSRASLGHGMCWLGDMQKLVAEPGVDLVIIGEPHWENEVAQYFFDTFASGQKKGLIALGQEVSEDPGMGEMATWLKSFVSEVPVQWIPAGDPSWMPY